MKEGSPQWVAPIFLEPIIQSLNGTIIGRQRRSLMDSPEGKMLIIDIASQKES